MEFQLKWSASALQDLESICNYIALDNPIAAKSVGREILERIDILRTFPDIGPFYPRRTGNKYREIIFSHYRIFYTSDKKKSEVKIVRIWHGARGKPKLK